MARRWTIQFDRMAHTSDEIFDIRRLAAGVQRERILMMERSTVIRFADRQSRESRIGRAMDARRRLEHGEPGESGRAPGRAWINGLEVGGGDRRFAHLAVLPHRGIRKRAEAVRQDVAAAQAGQHFEPARRRVVEMRHDRKPGLFGHHDYQA